MRKRTIARARLLTLLLLVVTAGYVAFALLRYLSYQDRIREILLSYPEELRPWMDFYPFTSTQEGSLIMVGGYLLVAAWLFLALFLMIIGKTAGKENQQILARPAICVLDQFLPAFWAFPVHTTSKGEAVVGAAFWAVMVHPLNTGCTVSA